MQRLIRRTRLRALAHAHGLQLSHEELERAVRAHRRLAEVLAKASPPAQSLMSAQLPSYPKFDTLT